MQQILDARAEALARPLSVETPASETVELLTFSVGNEQFAIETRFVTEVIHDVQVVSLPGETGAIVGVTNLRGEVLAVMSLSGVLSVTPSSTPVPTGRWVLVVGTDQPRFGIAARAVTEVVAVPNGDIVDCARAARISDCRIVRGVTQDGRMVLDGSAIMDDERFVIDESEV